jgi:hypothetical protein
VKRTAVARGHCVNERIIGVDCELFLNRNDPYYVTTASGRISPLPVGSHSDSLTIASPVRRIDTGAPLGERVSGQVAPVGAQVAWRLRPIRRGVDVQIRRRRERSADLRRVGFDELRLTARGRQAVAAVHLGILDAGVVVALLQEMTLRLRIAVALADQALTLPGVDSPVSTPSSLPRHPRSPPVSVVGRSETR